jgi:hypothetical protein
MTLKILQFYCFLGVSPALPAQFHCRGHKNGGILGRMATPANSSADRPAIDRPKDRQRSSITNGSKLLAGIDGRSAWVRCAKDVIAAHLSDVPDASAAERSIIRRAAVLTVELERLETQFALAGEADAETLDLYGRVSGNLRRLLEAVGLQRRCMEVGPTLTDLIRADQERQRQELVRQP